MRERGFSSVAHENRAQTCALIQNMANGVQTQKDTGNANTLAIIAKLYAMENAAMQDNCVAKFVRIGNPIFTGPRTPAILPDRPRPPFLCLQPFCGNRLLDKTLLINAFSKSIKHVYLRI